MARKKTVKEDATVLTPEQQIKILERSNEMLFETLKQTKSRKDCKNEALNLIGQAIRENLSQMVGIDPNTKTMAIEQMKKLDKELNEVDESLNGSADIDNESVGKKEFAFNDYGESKIEDKTSEIRMNDIDMSEVLKDSDVKEVKENKDADKISDDDTSYYFDVRDKELAYDVIPLPSHGEVYKEKVSKLSVAYLTAESENLITSPHLYKDDLIIDALLKYHVQNKGFNTDNLVSGDVDAIMLWLRATGYGNEYPIVVKDPESGEEFETIVDLSKIKIKDFTLNGDENGWFSYTLPIMKVEVKFRYLSRRDEKQLKRMNKLDSEESRMEIMRQDYASLVQCFKADTTLTSNVKENVKKSLDYLGDMWVNVRPNETISVSKMITNRLEMSVMEVNGKQDREYIRNFIRRMPALDSLKLRKYIEENRPSVDWNIEVERPSSLGGGSVSIFLEWGADAFLNVK